MPGLLPGRRHSAQGGSYTTAVGIPPRGPHLLRVALEQPVHVRVARLPVRQPLDARAHLQGATPTPVRRVGSLPMRLCPCGSTLLFHGPASVAPHSAAGASSPAAHLVRGVVVLLAHVHRLGAAQVQQLAAHALRPHAPLVRRVHLRRHIPTHASVSENHTTG
jgi:hypothetical protein